MFINLILIFYFALVISTLLIFYDYHLISHVKAFICIQIAVVIPFILPIFFAYYLDIFYRYRPFNFKSFITNHCWMFIALIPLMFKSTVHMFIDNNFKIIISDYVFLRHIYELYHNTYYLFK